ncbi:SAM-dependent methyltransferase [Nocardia sp. NPDC051030]|uniref:class I SAM-dependent methyltransferase n=1 Tax=Nocardia sp. NPDC051030 TaxID=3155162 RepID=UPI0034410EF9
MGVSFTAQTMALQRALETARPAGSRLFADPLAVSFLSGGLRIAAQLARVPMAGRLVSRAYDAVWPGPRPSAVVRTRLIDDTVTALVADGVRRVVLLGAGFDSRAWRLDALREATVVEIDLPATQSAKRIAVERAGADPDRVRFLPVDLETADLEKAIRATGFEPDVPTLVVWEGVTNYLTAEAVDRTLAAISALVGPDGLLLFTFVHAGALDGSTYFPEAEQWVRSVARVGEPWTFGLDPNRLAAFLTDRGYELVWEQSTATAGHDYFTPLGRSERASELYRVALATVSRPE